MTIAGTETSSTLETLATSRRVAADDRLASLRSAAAESLARTGFPRRDDEEWRYTNIAPIIRERYRSGDPEAPASISELSLCDDCAGEIVFVNGRYSTRLSRVNALPAGVTLSTIANVDAQLLGRLADTLPYDQHPFVALNTAWLDDVLVLDVADRVVLEAPLHVVFLTIGGGDRVLANTRLVVRAGRDSRVSFTETYAGEGTYFGNSVTEIHAADGAVVEHVKLVRDSLDAAHIGNFVVTVQRSGSVQSRLFSFGGGLVRNELHALLNGEGAECILDGLYVNGGSQHTDNHTVIEHAKPHTTSIELYKGILDDRATGIFDGKIVVRKAAQKTSSRQTNNNLLLSREAVADSKPQLEIHADDVKCNHGSTIGQLNEDALFYLRSRGMDEAVARNLLTLAFASDIIDRVTNATLREVLQRELLKRVRTEVPR